jgi:Tfp pilus assembly protein FimT
MLHLHLTQIADHLRAARMAALEDQLFPHETCPENSNGKCDRH